MNYSNGKMAVVAGVMRPLSYLMIGIIAIVIIVMAGVTFKSHFAGAQLDSDRVSIKLASENLNLALEVENAPWEDIKGRVDEILSASLGQASSVSLAGKTRFPNSDLSALTITSDGAFTSTGAGTFSSTLDVTATTTLSSDVNIANWLTYKEKAFATTTAGLLVSADSGSTVYFSTTGGTTTLPAVTVDGAIFRFVVAGALNTTNDNLVILSAEGDNIEGTLIVNGAVVDCAGEDSVEFVTDGENVGDFFELRSDGANWFIGASGGLSAGKIICIDPNS